MPTDLPPAQRRLSLSGASAAGWLGRRGATVPPDPALRLYADALHDDGFSVARVWNTATTLAMQTRPTPLLLLVLDGAAVMADGRRVQSGDAVLLSSAESFAVPESLARIEVALSERSPLDARSGPRSAALVPGTAYSETLAAACHALLAGSATPADEAWPAARRALEDLTVAVLRAGDPWSGASATSVDLVRRAVRAVEDRAHDPDFSVEELARIVSVSERSLQRAFRSIDSSPRSAIREIRAREALRRLGARPDRTEAQRVARQTGFRTAEAMRSAIRASPQSDAARPPT
ncbi:helix-turn-helix domain-containing protein [Rathayibacter caricis]|uniref:helix-turn-helix domain-containing protein n=1 Tax=Rathayibacter caricis TaxID=110936 RepID=UPI001FB48DB5|nr:helix-turn-helix domain-containing protein [Rathayibacter caricis]MCJ1697444.1 helix-turn-helix domain-containing protein [Rathayibacter caricis]